MGTWLEWYRLRVNARSSTAAEKSGEGMALKIFTGARPFLKAYIKPFDIMEIRMLAQAEKKLPVPCFFYRINEVIQSNHSFCR